MRRNVAAYTQLDIARGGPGYISMNTNVAETAIEITIREEPREGEVYGREAMISLPRAQFSDLLLQALGKLYQ